jgi:outer membrane lipoprotein-sorting protein
MIQGQNVRISDGKIYVKDNKVRMENFTNRGTAITIIDLDTGKMALIHPSEKVYFETEATGFETLFPQSNKSFPDYGEKEYLGTETINGYECDKYLYTPPGNTSHTTTKWVSKKLGFPIKVIFPSPRGEMTIEYLNIKEGGVEDALFEIPAGYRKMEMSGRG